MANIKFENKLKVSISNNTEVDFVEDDHRTDILYKVIKVGKNCGDFLGIKENYFILLQPNTTIARFTIGNKDYFTVEMTDVVLAFTEKKEPSILNAN